jgi:hypothetical protein
VVIAAACIAIALNGSWGLLLFVLLVTAMVAWQLALAAAERGGRVSTGRRRALSRLTIVVFVVAAVLLGRAVS